MALEPTLGNLKRIADRCRRAMRFMGKRLHIAEFHDNAVLTNKRDRQGDECVFHPQAKRRWFWIGEKHRVLAQREAEHQSPLLAPRGFGDNRPELMGTDGEVSPWKGGKPERVDSPSAQQHPEQ